MALQATIGETTFHIGDTIRVHYKLLEKEKVSGKAKREVKEEVHERIQIFEGIVLGIRGKGENKTFTVRRIATDNIGVERIFPMASPWIKAVTVKRQAVVRRAKLYYLRGKIGKEAEKLKEKVQVAKPKAKRAKKETQKKETKDRQPVKKIRKTKKPNESKK